MIHLSLESEGYGFNERNLVIALGPMLANAAQEFGESTVDEENNLPPIHCLK
jgi:hypothetical protein